MGKVLFWSIIMRKKGRRNKYIYIFFVSLALVLTVGSAVMLISSTFAENKKQENILETESALEDKEIVINFEDVQTNNEIEKEKEKQRIEKTEKISEQDKAYAELVEKGKKVLKVDAEKENSITVAFAGDILLDDNYAMMSHFKNRGSNIEDTFSDELLKMMRDADIFMLNNEFTFTTRGMATAGKKFTFRSNPQNVDFLKSLGVDVVSLANNHAYDYGEISLLDTMDTLTNANIEFVGAGKNIDEAKEPLYLVANGIKIAVVSATQIERNEVPDTKEATADAAGVLRCMNPEILLDVIQEAENNSDFTILYIHWGTESQEEIDWLQDEQAKLYTQAGVDLIIGNHAHCLQKIDFVNNVPVIYGVGNFWFNSKTQNTCLVEIEIEKQGLNNFKFIPCIQENCRTRMLEGDEKDGVLNYMRGISPNVYIDNEGCIELY